MFVFFDKNWLKAFVIVFALQFSITVNGSCYVQTIQVPQVIIMQNVIGNLSVQYYWIALHLLSISLASQQSQSLQVSQLVFQERQQALVASPWMVHMAQYQQAVEAGVIQSSNCLLVHGKPGVGKKHIIRCLASSTDRNLIEVAASALVKKYADNATQAVQDLLIEADKHFKKAGQYSIVFVHGLEALIAAGGADDHKVEQVILRDLIAACGQSNNENIFFVVAASTDGYKCLPWELTKLFSCDAIIEIALPNFAERKEAIEKFFAEENCLVEGAWLDWLAASTKDFSMRDLVSLVSVCELNAAVLNEGVITNAIISDGVRCIKNRLQKVELIRPIVKATQPEPRKVNVNSPVVQASLPKPEVIKMSVDRVVQENSEKNNQPREKVVQSVMPSCERIEQQQALLSKLKQKIVEIKSAVVSNPKITAVSIVGLADLVAIIAYYWEQNSSNDEETPEEKIVDTIISDEQ